MAKKKIIDLRAAGDVPAGDVNITYNGVRIAGFTEDTDATLKTGMKRVEHDIEVKYTPRATGVPLTVTKPEALSISATQGSGTSYSVDEHGAVFDSVSDILNRGSGYVIPIYIAGRYQIVFSMPAAEDIYNITINGINSVYDGRESRYNIGYVSDEYPTQCNIVITNKE